VSVLDVARRLGRAAGRDVEPDVRGERDPSAPPDRQQLDSSALRTELRWAPEWDLDRGLPETYAWYAAQLAAPATA
jgi:nucleoside-diphosphate-sugar epimerase